jgi:hypothetical protein
MYGANPASSASEESQYYGERDRRENVPAASDPTTRKVSSSTVDVFPAPWMSWRIKVMIRSAIG